MSSLIKKIKELCQTTVDEVKKCTWPKSSELVEMTASVIFVLILLTLCVFGSDQLFSHIFV